jgi:membrane associated rhomboid family serine protease
MRRPGAIQSRVLIPLGTDRPIRRPSVVTPVLVVLCTAVFVVQAYAASQGQERELIERFAVIGGASFSFERTITYAFLHGGWMHIAGNMLFLWVFGRPVEDRLGKAGFAILYLSGAIVSGLGHAYFESGPAIGASGAVSAVTGAFLVLFPKTRIRVLWFMILISLMMAPAWFFIGLQIAWNIIAATTGRAGNVAVVAHLAGYAFGFAVAFALLSLGVIPREPYDLFSISKQAKRRREFQAAARAADRTMVARGPVRRAPKPQPMDERAEAVAADRAAVSAALSMGEMDEAISAYRTLVDKHASSRPAVTLPRNAQYRIATHFASGGDNAMAMRAFDDFLGAYPSDPEAPQIRVLLARLCVEIGATGRARRLLGEAIETTKDEGVRALARDELGALGGPDESGTTQGASA